MHGLTEHWNRITWLSLALLPVGLLFAAAVAVRRALYRAGLLPVMRLPVPIVVVGNITAGGSGKTPLVLWLARFLKERGLTPGILSRGYGGAASGPQQVTGESDPARVGDEPVLLAAKSGCPVWVGKDRVAAARALVAADPDCDVLISDDGLQHYRLGRNLEIAVVDGERGFGNGLPLPSGPLREPVSRLRTADAIVVNGGKAALRDELGGLAMTLEGASFHNLLNPEFKAGPEQFRDRAVHAIAGIGHPQRFFSHLAKLGLAFTAHAFPDHHAFTARDLDLPGAEAILMTEKDGVKCASFANEKHWVLAVEAKVDPALGEWVVRGLRKP